MADSQRRVTQAEGTDAPAATSAVTDGATVDVPEVGNVADTISNVNINGASIAYSPEDLESQRASPIEVDKYLSQEESWSAVKLEMGLEERTASLSLQEQTEYFQQQSLPSTSSQGFFPSHYAPSEGEAMGGASYTDMSSTMRVTREATNALYSDPLLLASSHTSSELTNYLSRSALNPREAGVEQQRECPGNQQAPGVSPHYNFAFINTPSPSNGSEGSQGGGIASPHISPQPQVHTGYQGMNAQGHNPSPTFSSMLEDPPSSIMNGTQALEYNHYPSNSSPTYNLAPNRESPPLHEMSALRASPYNYHLLQGQPQTPPSYINVSNRPPPISRASHVSPQTTPPHSSPSHPSHHQEEPKIRNGKMYTSYLSHNGHGGYMPNYERQNRHPSGPTPPPSGHARVYPTGQYSQANNMYSLPEVSLGRFLPGYEGAASQLSQSSQLQAQALPNLGSQAFHSYSNLSHPPPPQAAAQYPDPSALFSYYIPKPMATVRGGRTQGPACRPRTTSNSSSSNCGGNGRSRAQPAGNEGLSASGSIAERERMARRAARRLGRDPERRRKRGCTCYLCQIVFASSGHLKRHMEAHGSNRRFRCDHPYCDVAYSRQDNLKNHIERAIHRQEGDPYDIPVSDLDESECEASDYGYFSCDNDFCNVEPDDDSDGTPPGGPGTSGGGGGGAGGGGIGGVGVVL